MFNLVNILSLYRALFPVLKSSNRRMSNLGRFYGRLNRKIRLKYLKKKRYLTYPTALFYIFHLFSIYLLYLYCFIVRAGFHSRKWKLQSIYTERVSERERETDTTNTVTNESKGELYI